MNPTKQTEIRNCLTGPAQKRVDVPLNGSVLIVPMDFTQLTGTTTNMCQEVVLQDGTKKYRFVKQISSFGDIKLFDYYEADVREGSINDKFDLQFGGATADRHNIKIANADSSKHIIGLHGHVEIVDAKYCGNNFYVKIKTIYNEISWQRV